MKAKVTQMMRSTANNSIIARIIFRCISKIGPKKSDCWRWVPKLHFTLFGQFLHDFNVNIRTHLFQRIESVSKKKPTDGSSSCNMLTPSDYYQILYTPVLTFCIGICHFTSTRRFTSAFPYIVRSNGMA